MRRPTTEVVMTGPLNLGSNLLSSSNSGSTNNLSNTNTNSNNTASSAGININNSIADARRRLIDLHGQMQDDQRRNSPSSMNASSLPNNFATSSSIPSESLSGNTNRINVTRRSSPWLVFSPNSTAAGTTTTTGQQNNTTSSPAATTERTSSTTTTTTTIGSNRPERNSSSMFQNMFGASLPNLSSNNGQSNNLLNTSFIIHQPSTVIVHTNRSRNASGNQTQQQQQSNNQQQQAASAAVAAANSLQDLFNFGSRSTTQARMNDESSSNQSNNNLNNQQLPTAPPPPQSNNTQSNFTVPPLPTARNFTSSQRVRNLPMNSGFPYSYIYNFDPHLQCTSPWLIPEIRGRLEVDLQIPNTDLFTTTTTRPTATTNSSTNPVMDAETRNAYDLASRMVRNSSTRGNSDLRHQQRQQRSSANLEEIELLNDLKRLFSSYLENDELIRRIDELPRLANNSLSSFIDSMNILDLVSRGKSNITLELFMILAQEISISEFLKIIFTNEHKCLNRAKDSMISYARTNLLFNNEEPFDTSKCVDELLKIWKKVLTSSLDELKNEFTERTFSALLSELRANLSVFLRTFTRTFNNENENENNSFASSLYFAIQRLFIDFHSSLTQMFRNPGNVMRAYKNILIQLFPDLNVRRMAIAILAYRIHDGIKIEDDETDLATLKRNRFQSRILCLTDHQNKFLTNRNGNNKLINNQLNLTATSSTGDASSSSSSNSSSHTNGNR